MVSPSTFTVMASWNVFFSSPFGPLTLTTAPFAVTVTPLGTGTGIFPIRDIVSESPLPDQREELAAGARLARLTVGHQPLRGRQDRDAETVAHARDRLDAHVMA